MALSYSYTLRLVNGMEILAGLWLAMSPFGLGVYLLNAALWNSAITGALVIVVATLRLVLPPRYGGLSWFNVGLGLWMAASPFLFGFAGYPAALWNSVIVGLAISLLAFWSYAITSRASRLD